MDIQITTMGTKELWTQFRANPLALYTNVAQRLIEAKIEEAPTLSRALEEISPSEPNDPLDAYERLLAEAGIRTHSDPVAGYWASNAGAFHENEGTRALLTEFYARNWRKVSFAGTEQRATFLSDDGVAGSWERPYAYAASARQDKQIAPAIPLSELVAMTTPIDADTYKAYYLTYDAAQLRMFRVGESATLPLAKITGSDRTITLKKYGRALEASYEVLRRIRVDKLARFIQLQAIQSEIDKVAAAIDTLVNGDGNANTAATAINLTTLDSGTTASNPTLKSWIAFGMEFEQPYILTTALMQKGIALQIAMLDTGSSNTPLVAATAMGGLGTGLAPINQFADAVRYGWTSDAPANKILGIDNRFALERVTEIGAEISEMERFILKQTQVVTMSEVEGYACVDPNAAKLVVVNA
jgi:hypothetical protein